MQGYAPSENLHVNLHPPCPDSDKFYQIKWKVEYSTLKGRSCNMYYCNKLGRQDLGKLSSFRNGDIVHSWGGGQSQFIN